MASKGKFPGSCGILCLSLCGFLSAQESSLFQKPKHYTTGNPWAESVAVGDLNGDGKPDLVAVSNGRVGVVLGTGNGMFQYSNSYDSGGYAGRRVVLEDLNGDGKLDALIANADNTGVLLGNGDGTFQPAQSYGSGGDGWLAVADVNGDGKLDLFTTRYAGIEGLLGNGDGTFQAPQRFPAGEGVRAIAVHDVDGDGNADLMAVDDCLVPDNCDIGAVAVLLGNGDGTFQGPQLYSTGGMASLQLFVGDLNGDSKADALVLNMNDNSVAVLLGNGDGTFHLEHTYDSGGGYPMGLTAGDLNGDGKTDVVVTNPFDKYDDIKKGVVGVLLGNGDGTFQTAQTFRTGGIGAISTAVADLNGDSMPDLAVANECDTLRLCSYGLLGVLINRAQGFVTTTALISSPDHTDYGQAVTFTATVKSAGTNAPTGAVQFFEGTEPLGWVKLSNGIAILIRKNLPAGTHSITAAYHGDARSLKSSSAPVTQVVNIATSATTITSSLNPSAQGEPVMFTATVTSPTAKVTGTVTFMAGSTVLGTIPLFGGVAILTTNALPQGGNTITAVYDGTANIAPSFASMIQIVN
jgi:hypothetical protein